MTKQQRIQIIREGNKHLNNKNFTMAQQLFWKAEYHTGLIRIADYYLQILRKPIQALPLYLKCKDDQKAKLIYKGIARCITEFLKQDEANEAQGSQEVRTEITRKHTKG